LNASPKRVAAGILRNGSRILLTRRAQDQKQAGCWEFPGGKVEPNETPQAALARELQEELSLNCSIGTKLTESIYNYDHGCFIIMAYEADIISGTIKLSVHDKAEWVEADLLTTYNLSPADIPIASYLHINSANDIN
jgi:mutator protein MutT